MRIIGDLSSYGILQVEKTPAAGDSRIFNGKFAVNVPEMAGIDVASTSYISPVDGGDVSSLAMASLLSQYPMYSNVVFNPLLTAANSAAIDLTATFTGGKVSRAQIGRGAGPGPTGTAPNRVCVLPQNNTVAPARPGIMISSTIDISGILPAGADEVLVWWHIVSFSTSPDVSASFGSLSGTDSPALNTITEVSSQEPSGFSCFVSNDNGTTWIPCSRLTPTDLGVFGTNLRICFRNTNGSNRRYLTAYAILV